MTNSELAIHPELRAVKPHALPSNRYALGALQAFLRLVNRLHRRRFKQVITRQWIKSADGYSVPILVIRPAKPEPPMPALIYFHGGAFIMEGAPAHTENAVRYAAEVGCLVVFVEYRLAPWHSFPAGLDDCYAALVWTRANATLLGVDPARVVVGGDSAGGNLAAAVVQRAVQEEGIPLRGQLLLYPAVDLLCSRPSMRLYKDVPPFKDVSPEGIARLYLGRLPSRPLPRHASPIEGSLHGLPPAYVETPQFDPLHDQGVEYATALRSSGVEVDLNDLPGAIHGFDIVAGKSSVTQEAMARRIRFLKHVFA
jgi:acetyl esterase/lipase